MISLQAFPMWKLKREVNTSYHQMMAFFVQMFFPFIRLLRRSYFKSDAVLIGGKEGVTSRVVIYLVFPGGGSLADRLHAIDYFVACGSSVVVVINGSVETRWLKLFEERCAYVLLRSNKGYDFGGYQAGVLMLDNMECQFDHLHVINDSVLMPMSVNGMIFTDIESAAVAGFGGAVAMPFDKEEFGSDQLILSYWLYFSGATARSSYFKKYWSDYVATNSKVLTVRHGERGLSRAMAANGFAPLALHAASGLGAVLDKLDARTLATTLKYGTFTDKEFESRCDALLSAYSDSTEWAASSRAFILEVSKRRNFLHSFCYLAIAVLRIPFVKKSKMMLPRLMRQKYLAAVADGVLPRPADHVWHAVIENGP